MADLHKLNDRNILVVTHLNLANCEGGFLGPSLIGYNCLGDTFLPNISPGGHLLKIVPCVSA